MKRCPQCNRTYEDAKNFCLQDGTPLVSDVPVNQPPPTAPETAPVQATPTQPVGWSQAGTRQGQGAQYQQPRRKRRVWPWVVGVLGLVLVGGGLLVGGIGYLIYKGVREAERKVGELGTAPKRTDVKTYVNSRASFTGKLAEHYSDFSFDYPASWVMKESPGSSNSNFVKVERTPDGGTTYENFAVGWFTSTGTMEGDARLFPQLAQQLSAQFARGFPSYKKVSEGRTRVGQYDGYEFRFTGRLTGGGRSADVYGRAVMIPSGSTTQRNGVALIMLATSLAPEIKSVNDVGVRGELPVILDSFRLGGDAATSSAADTDAPDSEVESAVRTVLGGGDAGAPDDKDEVLGQLKEIEEEWARANREGDREAIGRILADEYIGTSSDGKTENKADYIKNLRPNPELVSPQEFEDLSLVLGGRRAILTGVTVAEFAGGRTERYRFVDIFVWRDGRWQAVTSTTSQIK